MYVPSIGGPETATSNALATETVQGAVAEPAPAVTAMTTMASPSKAKKGKKVGSKKKIQGQLLLRSHLASLHECIYCSEDSGNGPSGFEAFCMGVAGSCPCTVAGCSCKDCIRATQTKGNMPGPIQHDVEEPIWVQGARAGTWHGAVSGNALSKHPGHPCMPEEEVLEVAAEGGQCRHSQKGMQMRVLSKDQRHKLETQRVRKASLAHPLEVETSTQNLEEAADWMALGDVHAQSKPHV